MVYIAQPAIPDVDATPLQAEFDQSSPAARSHHEAYTKAHHEAQIVIARAGRARLAWRKKGLAVLTCTTAQIVHRRRLRLLAEHGKATQVTDELAKIKTLRMWQQGDGSMYAFSAIEKRMGNRFHQASSYLHRTLL